MDYPHRMTVVETGRMRRSGQVNHVAAQHLE
jgi:hypothetical protein